MNANGLKVRVIESRPSLSFDEEVADLYRSFINDFLIARIENLEHHTIHSFEQNELTPVQVIERLRKLSQVKTDLISGLRQMKRV